MSIIKILPENLINQIAAGEVVERPASVVKELLENSLDAGADKIVLEIKGAGDEMIKITDNGIGMNSEDAKLAFERHATSKISNQEDLLNIGSNGFRGEAIASIASVSHIVLRTKRPEDTTGTEVVNIGGDITKISEVSCTDGTVIDVRNLFYNTPARKKYLKQPSTEYQHIIQVFQSLAMINFGVHFKLVHDNKESFEYPKAENLEDRIRDVLGKHIAENLIPIFYESTDIKIRGFIGKPEIARSGNKHQNLFVNGRPIHHPLFNYAIAESYHSLLMDSKKPFFVINIEIKPELVDVNVHPRKLEIRFVNQSELFKIFQQSAKATLEKNILAPNFGLSGKQGFSNKQNYPDKDQIKAALDFTEQTGHGRLNKYSYKKEEEEELSMIPLAQIAKSYILAEGEEGLTLIDQHAAHERIKFEEFMDQYEKDEPEKQQLLIPQNIELSQLEVKIFESNKENFEKLGFEIEMFGGNTFIIHSVPLIISNENIEEIILNVMSDLSDKKNTRATKNPQERVIEYMACRSAIKFGKDLSTDEMEALIRKLDKLKRPYTCPHGRPSMIKISFNDLEKMFKRH